MRCWRATRTGRRSPGSGPGAWRTAARGSPGRPRREGRSPRAPGREAACRPTGRRCWRRPGPARTTTSRPRPPGGRRRTQRASWGSGASRAPATRPGSGGPGRGRSGRRGPRGRHRGSPGHARPGRRSRPRTARGRPAWCPARPAPGAPPGPRSRPRAPGARPARTARARRGWRGSGRRSCRAGAAVPAPRRAAGATRGRSAGTWSPSWGCPRAGTPGPEPPANLRSQ